MNLRITREKNMDQVTDDTFDTNVIKSAVPVMVDFWATWCPPCRRLLPIIEELAESNKSKIRILKLDTDSNEVIPITYNIQSIPTLIIFKDGKEVTRISGTHSKTFIQEAIDKVTQTGEKNA